MNALLLSGLAWAAPFDVPEPPVDLRWVGPELWIPTGTGAWWLEPTSGAARPAPADPPWIGPDGVGACGSTGLIAPDHVVLVAGRCTPAEGVPRFVIVGSQLFDGADPRHPIAGATVGPSTQLACDDHVCVLADDQGVRAWRDGAWTALSNRPTDALAVGGGHIVWRAAGEVFTDGVPTPVLPSLVDLRSTPYGVLFVHTELLGTWRDGAERAEALPPGVGHSLGPDGPIWATERAVHGLGSTRQPGWDTPTQDPTPPAAPVERPPLVPLRFATPWYVDAAGNPTATPGLTVGGGVSAGIVYGVERGLLGSPWLFGAAEFGHGRTLAFVGADTAPSLLQFADSAYWHFVGLQFGGTVGGPQLRVGPFVGIGLVHATAGLRTVATLWRLRSGAWHGVEMRASVGTGARLGPNPPIIGEVLVAWAVHAPLAKPIEGEPAPAEPWCHHFTAGAGAAIGTTGLDQSWEHLDDDQNEELSASPSITAACETGDAVAFSFGIDSAPWVAWRLPLGSGDDRLHHIAVATLGPTAGNDTVRFGAGVAAGVFRLGPTAHLTLTPFALRDGSRIGLDLRAGADVLAPDSFHGALHLVTRFDPRVGLQRHP